MEIIQKTLNLNTLKMAEMSMFLEPQIINKESLKM
jgi:hypothetical protein